MLSTRPDEERLAGLADAGARHVPASPWNYRRLPRVVSDYAVNLGMKLPPKSQESAVAPCDHSLRQSHDAIAVDDQTLAEQAFVGGELHFPPQLNRWVSF